MKQIIECVPNFSEGRDLHKIEKIVDCFRGQPGVKLLDYTNDEVHNRLVVTVVGEREPLKRTVLDSVGKAVQLIDLNEHKGQHPRMGAVDVIPFTPIRNVTMQECVDLSKELGNEISELYSLPVFLYGQSATTSDRENICSIRNGEFEGMAEKLRREEWTPDFGPKAPHPTAGVVAVGARTPLVAFKINLNTTRYDIAVEICRKLRSEQDGYNAVRAFPSNLSERGMVQISINMTDVSKTALYSVFETVRFEAMRWGVTIAGSEIVGLVPMTTLVETAEYYLGIEKFSVQQVLESRIMDEFSICHQD